MEKGGGCRPGISLKYAPSHARLRESRSPCVGIFGGAFREGSSQMDGWTDYSQYS